jgi:hypothetical protein
MAAATAGFSFADLCEQLLAWHDEAAVAARAVVLLRTWTEDQWLHSMSAAR